MKYFAVVLMLLLFSSCAVVPHLDEALTLKEYSDDKDAQAADVVERDRKFEELVSFIKNGDSLQAWSKKADFVAKFGEPVLTKSVSLPDGQIEDRLLYRHAMKYFDGPKVYVFFDETGLFKRVEHEGF